MLGVSDKAVSDENVVAIFAVPRALETLFHLAETGPAGVQEAAVNVLGNLSFNGQ